ncbi:MAG: DNA adenine methylase, partial [Marmoricola sp.]
DPPYNQHRYFTNYHVWETLVRHDEPEHYGIACKRLDARDQATKSVFNYRATMPDAVRSVIARTRARLVVASYNDESWMSADEISRALAEAGHETVAVLGFDSRRYIGAQIGIHNLLGERVGEVSHVRNTEYLFLAGPRDLVEASVAAAAAGTPVATR